MVDLGPLNIDKPPLPALNISEFVPAIAGGGNTREPLSLNTPRAVSGYQNKYLKPDSYLNTLAAQYPTFALNAVRDYDAQRASKGQSPLSERQTRNVLETITTGKPATPEPKRSPWNFLSNAVGDATNILRSIPRIPTGLYRTGMEAKEQFGFLSPLGRTVFGGETKVPEQFRQAIQEGGNNPLNLLKATAELPGYNLFPGSFIAANLQNPAELARHPLFTVLDVLPGASKAAKGSKLGERTAAVARALDRGDMTLPVQEALRIQDMASNPLRAVINNRITGIADDGTMTVERSAMGQVVDAIAETKPFRAYSQAFGRQAREAMFITNQAVQRVRGIMQGEIKPQMWDEEVANFAGSGMEDIARKVVDHSKQVQELIPQEQMADLYQRLQLGNLDGMTDEQLTATQLIDDMNREVSDWAGKNGRMVMFRGETYDVQQGAKLLREERRVADMQRWQRLRSEIEQPLVGPMADNSPASVLQDLVEQIANRGKTEHFPGGPPLRKGDRLSDVNKVSNKELSRLHRVSMAVLERKGWDTAPLKKAFKDGADAYGQALGRAVADGLAPKNAPMSITELSDILKSKAGKSKEGQRVTSLNEALARGHSTEVTRHLNELIRSNSGWMTDEIRDSLRYWRDTMKVIDRDLKDATIKNVDKARQALTKVVDETPPSRFVPLINKRTAEKYLEVADEAQVEAIAGATDLGMLSQIPGFDEQLYRRVQRDVAKTWRTMRDTEKLDPRFLHSVSPRKANQVLNPTASIIPSEASSVKKRTLDMTPSVQDTTVALTHQALEFLSQRHTEIAISQIIDQMGTSERLLRERYLPTAERLARTNSALTVEGHLQELIAKNYRRFDPDTEGYTWGSPYLKKIASDQPYIPINVYKNLKSMADPKSLLGGVLDPVTGLFRMATTSLSIRTQLYNIIGGAIATELQNPGALLRSGRKAFRWARNKDDIPETLRSIVGSQKHTLLEMDREAIGAYKGTRAAEATAAAYHYLRGRTLGRLLKESQARLESGVAREPGLVRRGLKGLQEKSYGLNGAFDDFYRMTTYIDEYERAVKGGANVASAEAKAIGAMRKTFQDWLSQTPFERAVMKSVFPFYGYMSYAMRFVLRYPIDHSIRTEFMTKIAEAELEENSTLPSRFLNSLFFGGAGSNGAQNALNLGPMNPFSDVANYMTIKGALGATNPVIQTVLQMAGVENGEASLYPSLRYDSETGRLGIKTDNPIMALIENTIPQSTLLTSLLGVNTDFNDAMQRDPAAAHRMLVSGLTLPIPWRRYNVPAEQIKAEVARTEAQDKVREQALKTGDWSEALAAYPDLREYMEALDSLPPETVEKFKALSADEIKALPQTDAYSNVPPLNEQIEAMMSGGGMPKVQLPGYTPADAGIAMLSSRGGI